MDGEKANGQDKGGEYETYKGRGRATWGAALAASLTAGPGRWGRYPAMLPLLCGENDGMMAAEPGPGDGAGQLGRRAAEGHGEKRIEGNRNGNELGAARGTIGSMGTHPTPAACAVSVGVPLVVGTDRPRRLVVSCLVAAPSLRAP